MRRHYWVDRGPGWSVWFTADEERVRYVLFFGYPPAILDVWSMPIDGWERWPSEAKGLLVDSFLDRARKIVGGVPGELCVQDPGLEKIAPNVHVALTCPFDEGKGSGNRFSLTIFAADGVWKVILRDKQEGLALWIASKTFSGWVGVLEKALSDPETQWRRDRFSGAEQASRTRRK